MSNPSTPKQRAFLAYLGIQGAEHMTSQQASEVVDRVRDDLENYEGDDREERWARFRAWHMDRILLYPEIYASELRDYLKNELAEVLHSYVRSRITGCSARLTKSKIREVVKVLTNEDSVWWQNPNHGAIFFERLREVYPECCDGRSPVVAPRQIPLTYPTKSFHRPKSRKKNGRGCLGLVILIIVVVGLIKSIGDRPSDNKPNPKQENAPKVVPKAEKETPPKTQPEDSTRQNQRPPIPPVQAIIPKSEFLTTFEGVSLPVTVITTEAFDLMNEAGKETAIPVGSIVTVEKRGDNGTLTTHIKGALFVGSELRLSGKVKLR